MHCIGRALLRSEDQLPRSSPRSALRRPSDRAEALTPERRHDDGTSQRDRYRPACYYSISQRQQPKFLSAVRIHERSKERPGEPSAHRPLRGMATAAMFHSRSEFPLRDPTLQDCQVGKVFTPICDASIPGESRQTRGALHTPRPAGWTIVSEHRGRTHRLPSTTTITAVPRYLIVKRGERREIT